MDNAPNFTDDGFENRAKTSVSQLLGVDISQIVTAMEAITVVPGKLGGSYPSVFTTTLFSVDYLTLDPNDPAKGMITFTAGKGRMIVELANMQGYACYIECKGRAPDPTKALRWDSLVSDDGPVNGRLTMIPGTGLQYFATPPATRAEPCVFTIDAMTGDTWPQDDHWDIEQVSLLRFTLA